MWKWVKYYNENFIYPFIRPSIQLSNQFTYLFTCLSSYLVIYFRIHSGVQNTFAGKTAWQIFNAICNYVVSLVSSLQRK